MQKLIKFDVVDGRGRRTARDRWMDRQGAGAGGGRGMLGQKLHLVIYLCASGLTLPTAAKVMYNANCQTPSEFRQ